MDSNELKYNIKTDYHKELCILLYEMFYCTKYDFKHN